MASLARDASEEAASSSLFLTDEDHHSSERAARRRRIDVDRLALPRPGLRPSRYPGDGFDYRRPVTSRTTSAAAPVIDLTNDDSQGNVVNPESATAAAQTMNTPRGPRFGRAIIDIAGEEEHESLRSHSRARDEFPRSTHARPQYSYLRRPARPPSPPIEQDDVEIVGERPRSRQQTQSRQPTPAFGGPRSITPYPTGFEPIDLTNDDDVVHLNTRPRDGVNATRPGVTAGLGTRSVVDRTATTMGQIAEILRDERANIGGRLLQRIGVHGGFGGQMEARPQNFTFGGHNHQHNPHRPFDRHNLHGMGVGPPRPVEAPRMDYGAVGWEMDPTPVHRPPTPQYNPPPEPERGFTRGPKEDEVVVCPNCGDELAIVGSEEKQKIWVVKTCGHVSHHSFGLLPDLHCIKSTDRAMTGVLRRMRTKSYRHHQQKG